MIRTHTWLLLILYVLVFAGCGDNARSLPTGAGHPGGAATSSVGDTLQTIGVWGLWVGSISFTLATLALIASFFSLFGNALSGLRGLLVDALILSGALIVVSASIDYLGEHPWILAVIVGVVGLVLLIRYRPVLEKDLGIDQPVTPVALVPAAPAKPVVPTSATVPAQTIPPATP